MTLTLEDVLRIRKQTGVLHTPSPDAPDARLPDFRIAAATPATTNILVKNTTSSGNLYAIVTGIDLRRGVPWFLRSDGRSDYHPANPSADQQPLQADVAIPIGGPGASRTLTIPKIAGGRVWYSKDSALTFRLNRGGNGPGIVEPSSTNPSDPGYRLNWGFMEFTYDDAQIFANITYVDFISIPVSMSLTHATGGSAGSVKGTPPDGLSLIATQLEQQASRENVPSWARLVVRDGSRIVRILSPNSGMVMDPGLFNGYFDSYVNQVWQKYASEPLTVNTQHSWGTVRGTVQNNALNFGSAGVIRRPPTQDIFGCVGVFPGSNDQIGNIGARIAAGFNRGTLLKTNIQPDGAGVESYYTVNGPTNHYSRILHAVNLDGLGYAFPYDDVGPSGGKKQEGAVSSGNPGLLTVNVGGGGGVFREAGAEAASEVRRTVMSLREMARPGRQMVGGRRLMRRGLEWSAPEEEQRVMEYVPALAAHTDEKVKRDVPMMEMSQVPVDLEKGALDQAALEAETQEASPRTLLSVLPAGWVQRGETAMARLESSPAYMKLRPIMELLMRAVAFIMSLSLRAIVSRVSMVVFFILFYFLLGPIGKAMGLDPEHVQTQSPDGGFEGGLKRQFG